MKPLRRYLVFCLVLTLALGNLPLTLAVKPDEIDFTILHTNDEHSALLPLPLVDYDETGKTGAAGGFARLAGAVQAIRAEKAAAAEPVLLISAGDYLSGSPFAWLALDGQAPELELMLALGYDVITIGNHEWDYGPDVLAEYLQAAGYPAAADRTAIVASNTVIPATHSLAALGIQSTYIKTLENGLRVGFFGLLGEAAVGYTPSAQPITFSDQQAAAAAAVAELEAAGADVIVAVSHCGEDEEEELAQAVPGIDVIIGGHTHELLEEPLIVGKTIIAQAGTQLSHLGMLELSYNRGTDQVSLRNGTADRPCLLPLDTSVPMDPAISAQVARLTQDLNQLVERMTGGRFSDVSQTVIRTDFPVSDKPEFSEITYGNFITDAMRIIGEQVTGEKVDFAFEAYGVIRDGLTPGTLPGRAGQVTLFDLVNTVGLGSGPDGTPGYPLISAYFTGEEVRRIMEVSVLLSELDGKNYFFQYSGLRLEYDPDRAILFTLPIKNLPIPTTRAVLSAERYTGSGVQTENDTDYAPLKRGDEQLYHVITDYYLAAYLPMVGEILPSLGLVMKDKDGNPLQPEDCIVYRDGQEFKVWQAVLEYAAGQPTGDDGIPAVPNYYAQTTGRIVKLDTLPIWLWPLVTFLVVLCLLIFGIRRWRRARRERTMRV